MTKNIQKFSINKNSINKPGPYFTPFFPSSQKKKRDKRIFLNFFLIDTHWRTKVIIILCIMTDVWFHDQIAITIQALLIKHEKYQHVDKSVYIVLSQLDACLPLMRRWSLECWTCTYSDDQLLISKVSLTSIISSTCVWRLILIFSSSQHKGANMFVNFKYFT